MGEGLIGPEPGACASPRTGPWFSLIKWQRCVGFQLAAPLTALMKPVLFAARFVTSERDPSNVPERKARGDTAWMRRHCAE